MEEEGITMEPTERREDVEVLAHVHLRKEHINLEHALQAISDWVRSGAGEGANFLVTRLTGPIAGGSLFGGADISQFTPPVPGGHCTARAGLPITWTSAVAAMSTFPSKRTWILTREKSPSPGCRRTRQPIHRPSGLPMSRS